MKNTLKKVMVCIMAFALLVGAVSAPAQQAQAASKLTKADFKFTGKYKSNFNKVIKLPKSKYYAVYANTLGEKAPKKCIKTKRGITLGSTKAQVQKKYGKNTYATKFKWEPAAVEKGYGFYWLIKKGMDKKAFNMVKNKTILQYTYEKNDNMYTLIFVFDKKNKVNTIIATEGIWEW